MRKINQYTVEIPLIFILSKTAKDASSGKVSVVAGGACCILTNGVTISTYLNFKDLE